MSREDASKDVRTRRAHPDDPEFVIAYPEELARAMCADSGLGDLDTQHGTWCGTPGAVRGQDIVLARRPVA